MFQFSALRLIDVASTQGRKDLVLEHQMETKTHERLGWSSGARAQSLLDSRYWLAMQPLKKGRRAYALLNQRVNVALHPGERCSQHLLGSSAALDHKIRTRFRFLVALRTWQ